MKPRMKPRTKLTIKQAMKQLTRTTRINMKAPVVLAAVLLLLFPSMLTPGGDWQTAQAYDEVNERYFPKPNAPEHLYVIEADDMNAVEASMIVSLQGLLAKTKPEIYVLPESNRNFGADRQAYLYWLEDMALKHDVTYSYEDDPWDLLQQFEPRLDGYVLYDFQDNSLNAATSIAGLYNAVIVEDSLEGQAIAAGLSLVVDVRGKDEEWVFDNYWSQLRQDMAFEQSDTWEQLESGVVGWGSHATMRDYAIYADALTFFEEGEYPLRGTIINALDDDSPVVGYGDYWNLGEDGFIGDLSRGGTFNMAANHAFNMSTLAAVPVYEATQQTPATATPQEENVHYVTLIWSDGDNPQWELGAMPTMDTSTFSWWANAHRGDWNMGWGLSAGMIDFAPSVVQWYYDQAANGTYSDDFVLYGAGGYMYPSLYPQAELVKNAQRTNGYLERMDTGALVVIDEDSITDTDIWDLYTAQPKLDGIFYLDYQSYHKYNGQIVWSNDKPVISARYSLWEGIQSEAQIASAINASSTNVYSPGAYSMISVHAWSKTMDDVKTLVDSLGPHVRVVTPSVFIDKIRENVTPGTGIPGASSRYMLFDDFADGEPDGWQLFNGSWSVVSETLTGTANSGEQSYALAGDEAWRSYDLEARVRLVSGFPDAGIAFRAADVNNHYLLAIREDHVELYKRVGGVYTALGLANTTNTVGDWLSFRVSLNGNQIEVFKEGTLLLSLADASLPNGMIGLRTVDGNTAQFDDVKVYENASTTPGTLFLDTFDVGNAASWTSSGGTWAVEDGEYSGTAGQYEQSFAFAGDSGWSDYTLTALVNLKSGPQDAGLVFRVTDENNHYLLAVRDSGVELYKRESGVYTSLATAVAAHQTDQWYRYQIVADGDLIRVVRDTVVLFSVTDTTFASGFIGLRVSGGTHAHFDQVRVASELPPAPRFADDFTDGTASAWTSNDGSWAVESGEYSGTADATAQSYSLAGDTAWTDYVYTANVQLKSGPQDAGLAFRVTDVLNHYMLAIRDTNVELYKRVGGSYTSLGSASASHTVDTWYAYEVELEGNRLRIRRDNQLLLDVTDSTFAQGRIGLRTAGSTHTHFDNIVVY